MSLRKSVLLKQRILNDVSLNVSSSDSVVEDSDSSIYYSFVNDSLKSVDGFSADVDANNISGSSEGEDKENTSISSDNGNEDKEKTVIMRQSDQTRDVHDWFDKNETELEKTDDDVSKSTVINVEGVSKVGSENAEEQSDFHEILDAQILPKKENLKVVLESAENQSVVQELLDSQVQPRDEVAKVDQESAQDLSNSPEILATVSVDDNQTHATPNQNMLQILESAVERRGNITERSVQLPISNIQIVVQDPNENIINPFTEPEVAIVTPLLVETQLERSSAPTTSSNAAADKSVTRRSVALYKFPPYSHVHMPVMRRSLDRKAKAAAKQAPARRTIYKPPIEISAAYNLRRKSIRTVADASTQAVPSKIAKAKTPTSIPKPEVKPKTYKCATNGCPSVFSTMKALQEHQKTHKSTSASSSSFLCKWCDKKFQIEAALKSHQVDKCTRIPFNEKRKFLAQREKTEINRRRTTLFTVPMPKLKSPLRKVSKNTSLNKSGIKVTPKKSLKCHICAMIISDAFVFANHMIAHKNGKVV